MEKERVRKKHSKTVIISGLLACLYVAMLFGVVVALTTKDVHARGITTFSRAVGAPDDISAAVYREVSDTQSLYVISGKLPDPASGHTYRVELVYAFPKLIKNIGNLSKDENGNWALTTTIKKSLVRYTSMEIVDMPGNKALLLADFKNETADFQPTPSATSPDTTVPVTPDAATPSTP